MKRIYHTNLAFLDMLFNTLLCFAALFMFAFILINPSKNENNIKAKADFVITVSWDGELDNDVDTYVKDPQGNLVAFMRREEGLMHLDRDDLGQRNDIIQTPLGPVEYKENREIVTLRGFTQGEYIVNVHMYMKRDPAPETVVTISLDKINPMFQTIVIKEITLVENGDEKTAFRFVLDRDGEVIEVNELPQKLVQRRAVSP